MRDPNDDFFVDTSTVGEWEHFWGQKSGKVGSGTSLQRLVSAVKESNQ